MVQRRAGGVCAAGGGSTACTSRRRGECAVWRRCTRDSGMTPRPENRLSCANRSAVAHRRSVRGLTTGPVSGPASMVNWPAATAPGGLSSSWKADRYVKIRLATGMTVFGPAIGRGRGFLWPFGCRVGIAADHAQATAIRQISSALNRSVRSWPAAWTMEARQAGATVRLPSGWQLGACVALHPACWRVAGAVLLSHAHVACPRSLPMNAGCAGSRRAVNRRVRRKSAGRAGAGRSGAAPVMPNKTPCAGGLGRRRGTEGTIGQGGWRAG